MVREGAAYSPGRADDEGAGRLLDIGKSRGIVGQGLSLPMRETS